MRLLDLLVLTLLRAFVFVLNSLPLPLRERLVNLLLRAVLSVIPSYRKIAFKNLELVFPQLSAEQHEKIYRDSICAFGRIFIDLARMHTLDESWVKSHVECPYLDDYRRIKREHPDTGVIFATGHLGSFEVLGHCVPYYGNPISFVVRSFNLPLVNQWWRSKREVRGNRAIDRRGAFKEVSAELGRGRDVAVLFDQNLTRNHAVFVPFFGKPAATTKLVGLAALRAEAPIVVASITYLGSDRYRINAAEIPCADIYCNKELSTDSKVRIITERITAEYEKMILANPGEWFWFHRRWKTQPEGIKEDFYRS